MQKLFYGFLISLVIIVICSVPFTAQASESPCEKITVFDIQKHFVVPISELYSVNNLSDVKLCQITVFLYGRPAVFYMPYDKEYVFGGELFVNQKMYTQSKISEVEAELTLKYKDKLEALTSIIYTPEGANKDRYIYFFTDPDCPYCEQAKGEVKKLAGEKKFTVKVIFFPLPIHPGAKEKAVKMICSNATYDDYMNNKYGDKTCPEGEQKVNEAISLAEKLYIGGTPTFITSSGKRVAGFNPRELLNW